MATVEKDFKVKKGLIVEGTTATVNNYDVLTKKPDDNDYIIGLIGGSSDSANTPNTVVKRDNNGDFAAGVITADLVGDVTGQVSDISNHSTSDLAEGTNKYYTDARVKDVLVNSTQTNIQISEVSGVLHITAENGVADSTTDDLTEGTTNKYFTNQRAVDANTGLWDTAGSANNAYNDAVSAAASDATTKANNAEQNANAYTDGEITAALQTAANDATTKANNAESAANSYTNGEITTALSTAQGYANQALSDANAYTDNAVSGLAWKQAVNLLWDDANASTTGATGTLAIDGHTALTSSNNGYRILIKNGNNRGIWEYSDNGSTWTLSRPTDADTYSELIGAAVYVMEGNQYGSTSWVQSNHYSTAFTDEAWTQFSGQGSVTAGTGITVNGLEVSVNRSTVDGWYDASGSAYDAEVAAKTYADGLAVNYDASGSASNAYNNAVSYTDGQIQSLNTTAQGYANTAEQNAKNYADGLATNYDPSGSAFSAEQNANSYTNNQINSLTTDDIEEGTFNHYFTDQRAENAAGNLLANATKQNITISYANGSLNIAAENGVADSTTDDLTEGVNHLYFTNQRAVSALEAVVPNFTEVDINSLATQVAATTGNIATASQNNVAYAFAKADYRSAKFLVKCAYGTHTELAEVLLTLDSTDNIAITEYAIVGTNGSSMTVSADVSGSNVRLLVTTVNNNSTVTVVGTLLA